MLFIGNSLQNIFLNLRANFEGFSLPLIGAMSSTYFAGFVLGCFAGTRFVQQVGHIRTFGALASIAASVALVHSLWIDPLLWIPLRAITGFCMAGLYVVIESWINEFAQNQNRGRIISQYRITDLLATIVGQFFLLSADPHDFNLFTLLALFITLSLVPVTLTQVKYPALLQKTQSNVKGHFSGLWKTSPLAVVGCFTSGFVSASYWAMSPVFVTENLGSYKLLPWFTATYLIGGTLSQWPLGWLSDRTDRRFVLLGASILSGLGAFMIYVSLGRTDFLGQTFWFWIMVFGAGTTPIYSISIAHANDQAGSIPVLSMSSLLLLTSSAGSVSGPYISSQLSAVFGSPTLFLLIPLLQVLMAAYCIYRLFIRAAVPIEEKSGWVSYPRTTPTLMKADQLERSEASDNSENTSPTESVPEK